MPTVRSFLQRITSASLVVIVLVFMLSCESREADVPTSDPPLVKHVLIVSIDGCRPDMLLRANTPNIRNLMKRGCYTFWARTTAVSITLPSHVSMLTGVTPEIHGITWNDAALDDPVVYPNSPTLFEVAKLKGLSNGVFAGKLKFNTFTRPNVVDWEFITPKKQLPSGKWVEQLLDDDFITRKAAAAIRKHKPNVTFVHLPAVDALGHKKYPWTPEENQGWGSDEQMWGIERADACIDMLLNALKDAGIYNDTLIIVTADHGGAGSTHGRNDPRSRHIPWICVGPGVRQNYDLTRIRNLTVRVEDTFATASYFLGLPINPQIQGRPVMQVLDKKELGQAAK